MNSEQTWPDEVFESRGSNDFFLLLSVKSNILKNFNGFFPQESEADMKALEC